MIRDRSLHVLIDENGIAVGINHRKAPGPVSGLVDFIDEIDALLL